jgi:hypothetical protein
MVTGMNARGSMTDLARAVSIASGVQSPNSTDEFVWAYQVIVEAAIVWTLPAHVGEIAWEMIEAGDVYQPSFRAGPDTATVTHANE